LSLLLPLAIKQGYIAFFFTLKTKLVFSLLF
jgi:hypothetical protein